jgi:low temperature requirement protein LtrA
MAWPKIFQHVHYDNSIAWVGMFFFGLFLITVIWYYFDKQQQQAEEKELEAKRKARVAIQK